MIKPSNKFDGYTCIKPAAQVFFRQPLVLTNGELHVLYIPAVKILTHIFSAVTKKWVPLIRPIWFPFASVKYAFSKELASF